jgi:predicted nucleic acid-binding protein
MRLVIDTNRIIAGLIRDGPSRVIIFSKEHQFFTPEYALIEINRHRDELCEKARISPNDFEMIMKFLFEKITIVPQLEYNEHLEQSKAMLSDKDDAPFLALAIALEAEGIWTEDIHFLNQKKVKIFTNREIFNFQS